MTVIEGASASTNLPDDCCEAIFLRNVYHQVAVDEVNRSTTARLNLAAAYDRKMAVGRRSLARIPDSIEKPR